MMSTHGNRIMSLRQRRCSSAEIGIGADGNGRTWPAGEVLLASVTRPHATHHLLSLPQAVLGGERLTGFLGQVAPFGCPAPPSLIRASRLPDAPYPSALLKEHEDAPTKARKITGRELPVWVDLPAHEPSLLASPLLARVERLLADT